MMKKLPYLLFFLALYIPTAEASDSGRWPLFGASVGCVERVQLLKGATVSCDEYDELRSDLPEMDCFLSSCNQILEENGHPFAVTSFTYLSPETPLPDVDPRATVSLDFEFANNSTNSGYKTTRIFAIRSLQLLVNQDLYIYDFNRASPSEEFIASLGALCAGESLKLVFGGENDILLLSSLTGLGPAKLSNMLDIQKISLIVTGNRQLMNLQKTIKKKLPFQFEDIEGYRKISFHEWYAGSEALSLEQMISGATDVIFLTSLLTSLDFDSKPRLWSRYNAEMKRYYRKTLAQGVQIVSLPAREKEVVEERFEVERARPSLRRRRAYPSFRRQPDFATMIAQNMAEMSGCDVYGWDIEGTAAAIRGGMLSVSAEAERDEEVKEPVETEETRPSLRMRRAYPYRRQQSDFATLIAQNMAEMSGYEDAWDIDGTAASIRDSMLGRR